jgi:hypothetical protein
MDCGDSTGIAKFSIADIAMCNRQCAIEYSRRLNLALA